MRMMSGDSWTARSNALRVSSASPTMSKPGLPLQDVAHANAEEGVVVDQENRRLLSAAAVWPRPAPLRPGVVDRTHALSSPTGIDSQTTVPPPGRDRTSNLAPMSSARSRMNWRPKLRRPLAATALTSKPRPSSETSRIQSSRFDPRRHDGAARVGVLADVLERLLDDAQDGGLLGRGQDVAGRPQLGLDRGAGEGGHALDRIHDRAVQAELVEKRRPQLADEGADLAQLAAQQLAQEAQLAAGDADVLVEHPLDVLDLEDRVRQRLRRPVVDLLREPRPLGLPGPGRSASGSPWPGRRRRPRPPGWRRRARGRARRSPCCARTARAWTAPAGACPGRPSGARPRRAVPSAWRPPRRLRLRPRRRSPALRRSGRGARSVASSSSRRRCQRPRVVAIGLAVSLGDGAEIVGPVAQRRTSLRHRARRSASRAIPRRHGQRPYRLGVYGPSFMDRRSGMRESWPAPEPGPSNRTVRAQVRSRGSTARPGLPGPGRWARSCSPSSPTTSSVAPKRSASARTAAGDSSGRAMAVT